MTYEELEAKCWKLEHENKQLRKELKELKLLFDKLMNLFYDA